MKFEEAIKITGKASLECGGYVEFREDGILYDEKHNPQEFHRDYLEYTDWEPYYGDDCIEYSDADIQQILHNIEKTLTSFADHELFKDIKKAIEKLKQQKVKE